jgi:thiamine biosynthesis protein ThiI
VFLVKKYNSVLIRPGEFMVRFGSRIRNFMLSRLRESILHVLRRKGYSYDVKIVNGSRIVIDDLDTDKAIELADLSSKVFGVSSTSPANKVVFDFREVINILREMIVQDRPRSIKLVIQGSREYEGLFLEKTLASILHDELGVEINLSNPDREYIIDIRGGLAYITDSIVRGVGGLPYGVEGCLVVLVSGGVDSAVAAWYTMKRGVRIIPVYIDYGEYWDSRAHRRVEKMIEKLLDWVPWDTLRFYRLRGYEKLVLSVNIPPRLRCLFCKANMYRAAKYVALDEGCKGIVTGEAVGQVASQTLTNLSILSRLVDIPVYRPIAFMDKLEIIEEANKLGFAELNIRVEPCRLKPEHPETAASEKDYLLLREALRNTEVEAYRIYKEYKLVINY